MTTAAEYRAQAEKRLVGIMDASARPEAYDLHETTAMMTLAVAQVEALLAISTTLDAIHDGLAYPQRYVTSLTADEVRDAAARWRQYHGTPVSADPPPSTPTTDLEALNVWNARHPNDAITRDGDPLVG